MHGLFQAGVLAADENGILRVAQEITLEEFQDFEKDDEDMGDHDPRQKKKRYNDFVPETT